MPAPKRLTSPSLYLVRPSEFGVVHAPKFIDFSDAEFGIAGAVYWQHQICETALKLINNEPFGSRDSFIKKTNPPSPNALYGKLKGDEWFKTEDVWHLVWHLGRKVLPRIRGDRRDAFPMHLRTGTGRRDDDRR